MNRPGVSEGRVLAQPVDVSSLPDAYEHALLDAFESGMTFRPIAEAVAVAVAVAVAGSHTTLTENIKSVRARR